MKNRLIALLLLLCLVGAGAYAQELGGPLNLRVNKSVATSLQNVPDKARQRKDTIIFGVPDLIGVCNPLFATTQGDTYAASLMFDELVFMDEFGQWGDGLAAVTVSPDGLTYTFALREAYYADGVRVSADDCINTLYLLAMPLYDGTHDLRPAGIVGLEEYVRGEIEWITGIERLSDYSFSVTLGARNPSAPAYLALPALRAEYFGSCVRPTDLPDDEDERNQFYARRVAELKELNAAHAGYGQYDLVSLEPGIGARFTANDDYWRAKPSTPFIELLVVPVGAELEALTNGDVDIISCYSSVRLVDDAFNTGFISIFSWMGDVFGYLGFQANNPLFEDERVRQAFAYGLRRKVILQETLERYATVPGMMLFDTFAPTSDVLGEIYPYDAEIASQLLTEAGWEYTASGIREKDGVPFKLTFYAAEESPVTEVLAKEMAYCCEWLGIDLTIETLPYLELAKRVESNQCDMYLQARRIPASPAVAADLFAGDSHLNQSGYDSEGVQRFLRWAAKEGDASRQAMIYEGLYQQLYLELPMVPLYRRCELLLVNARIRNIYVSSGHDIVVDAYRMIISDKLTEE